MRLGIGAGSSRVHCAPPLLGVAIACLAASRALAQEPAQTPRRPAIKLLRSDEDNRFYADPANRRGPLDGLKRIALNDDGLALSFAADARLIYERFDATLWGSGPQDHNGYLLQRYFAHTELEGGDDWRAYVTIKSSLSDWRNGGPRPTDENRADVHQAFLDVRLRLAEGATLTLRPGRQELNYGASRVLSVRNGPNDRQAFDGGKAVLEIGGAAPVRIDGLYAMAVETDPGAFDDAWFDDAKAVWGVYATATLDEPTRTGIDAYYVGSDFRTVRIQRSSGDDRRHTIGGRWFTKRDGLDADVEGAVQFGESGGRDVLAGFGAFNVGYTFAGAPLKPRLALEGGVSSGDDGEGDVNTYNLLFARGGYYGELAILGNQNLTHLNPQIDWRLSETVTLTTECYLFWRTSADDGIYSPGGTLVRAGTSSGARFIGVQPTGTIVYRPGPRMQLLAQYAFLTAGGFVRDTGPGEDIHFVRLEFTFSF